MSALMVENIAHRFGELQVLRDVSFSVAAGELACLVGPSGCGKSTLLRLIAGLEEVQRGKIVLDGETVADSERSQQARKRRIGLMFQQPSLFPHLNVRNNIAFGLRHLSRDEQEQTVKSLLHTIGLESRGAAFPHQLSGGQQQRVALARALAPKPRIMLLDEPFANLDHAMRREMREEVLGMLKQAGIPVVMVTHEPEEALVMADKMVLLRENGALHQYGAPQDIYRWPADAAAASFFGPVNRIKAQVREGNIFSPFGTWPQKEMGTCFDEKAKVEIIARPESLRLSNEGAAVTVRQVRAAALGLRVTAIMETGDEVQFTVPYARHITPQPGDVLTVACESAHIFGI